MVSVAAALRHSSEPLVPPNKAVDGSPAGFRTLSMPEELVQPALEEVESAFQPGQWEVELQHSFASSRLGWLSRRAGSERFPRAYALMEATEQAFGVRGHDTELVQVAVRRYVAANGTTNLRPHLDDERMFGETVLSVVLRCDAEGDGLHLWPARRRPEPGEAFAVAERPGVATCLEGPARYDFVHAVPPVAGTRISMSWRWFHPEYMQWLVDRAETQLAAP